MSDEQLCRLWNSAATILIDLRRNSDHQAANETHDGVELEWKKRCTKADWTKRKSVEVPEDGMLKAFGYHVGETKPVLEPLRQKILIWVVERALPPVGSPYYLRQWGEPASATRVEKLMRTLSNLSQREESRQPAARTASKQRLADLEFLRDRYAKRGS